MFPMYINKEGITFAQTDKTFKAKINPLCIDELINMSNKLQKICYYEGKLFGISDTLLDITNIRKFGFERLDCDFYHNNKDILEIKLEYIKNDIEYKEEYDFENKIDYNEFASKMGDIVYNKAQKMINYMNNIINKLNLNIEILDMSWDEYDYPCIYIVTKLKYKW